MLGGDVEHSRDIAQHALAPVGVLVALDADDPIFLVNDEVDPRALFRAHAAKIDGVFPVRSEPKGPEASV